MNLNIIQSFKDDCIWMNEIQELRLLLEKLKRYWDKADTMIILLDSCPNAKIIKYIKSNLVEQLSITKNNVEKSILKQTISKLNMIREKEELYRIENSETESDLDDLLSKIINNDRI